MKKYIIFIFFALVNFSDSLADNMSLINISDSINLKSRIVLKPKLDLSISSGAILIVPFATINLRILIIDELSIEAGILGGFFSKELSKKVGLNFHLNDFSISAFYFPSKNEYETTSVAILLGKIPINKLERYQIFYRGGIAFISSGKEGGGAPVFEIGIMYNIN